MTLTVGSLFSGIGGLDLGLERANMKVIWQSEIDPYACRVLKKHWPEVPNYGDIKLIDWSQVERPSVICGGYPCQPFSLAGKRKGAEDERHLWPWVLESISALRPDYAILENVPGHITLGLSTVLGDLAAIGYDAEWHLVRASSIGGSHRRERLFIVAYPDHSRRDHWNENRISSAPAPDRTEVFEPTYASDSVETSRGHWIPFADVDRTTDGFPSRLDRLRGLGNAVVPQVAEVIGRLVMTHAGM